MAKSNLVKLAKGGSKSTPAKKTVEKKEVEKPLTPEEERDIKAKQKVEQLLKDVDLTAPKKEDDLLEVDNDAVKSGEWLEEQVTLLSEKNEVLRTELAQAKEDYAKLFQQFQSKTGGVNEAEIKTNVTKLFMELQNAYLQMGFNQKGEPNLVIFPIAFMNKLILFFPFLAQYKRF